MMRALAESGWRVDALRAFEEYGALLAEQTGTEPSHSITDLERQITVSR
jgi:DNA-binding SARP family transcriptional activator